MVKEIQEIKEQTGVAAEGIIARGMGLERKGTKYKCPDSHKHKNNDKNPSLAFDRTALQFYCFSCGLKLDIYQYHKVHEGKSHSEILREYGLSEEKPKVDFENELTPITQECIKYLGERKVSKDTIEHFKLQSHKGNIAFPYYNNGRITGVKYRQPRKVETGSKYLSITGSDFGFFNKQNVKQGDDEIIICEGEIDCLVLHQCGYSNVVSVGTGANSLDKLFRSEKNFLNSFPNLIIVSDNDEAGKKMDKAFVSEFGAKVKLVDKTLFKENDVNLEYYKFGKEKIVQIIESARIKIEGLRYLDYTPYKGMQAIKGSYIPTGIKTVDYALNDLAPQCVTLITGRSNDGKTTFVNQIMANAVDKGNSVLLVSGEGIQEIIINNFYKAVVGKDERYFNYVQVNKRKFKEPKPEVLKALQSWHKNKLTIFNKGDSDLKTTSQLFEMLSLEIKTNRHNLVVIDNLMSVLSVERAGEKLEAQADFLQQCCDLSKSENVHIILVLHPNKTVTKGSSMDSEQISGMQDLSNKADNIIAVKKEHDEAKRGQGISGEISVIKNRYFPDLPKVKTYYDTETGLLLEREESGTCIAYCFKWLQYLEGNQVNLSVEGFNEVIEPWDKKEE